MVRFSGLFSVNRLLAFFTGRAKHNVEREGMPTSGDGMVSAPLSPPPVSMQHRRRCCAPEARGVRDALLRPGWPAAQRYSSRRQSAQGGRLCRAPAPPRARRGRPYDS